MSIKEYSRLSVGEDYRDFNEEWYRISKGFHHKS